MAATAAEGVEGVTRKEEEEERGCWITGRLATTTITITTTTMGITMVAEAEAEEDSP